METITATNNCDALLAEENAKLRELVQSMWDTHVRSKKEPTAFGWIAIQEQAEELGIKLVRSKSWALQGVLVRPSLQATY